MLPYCAVYIRAHVSSRLHYRKYYNTTFIPPPPVNEFTQTAGVPLRQFTYRFIYITSSHSTYYYLF